MNGDTVTGDLLISRDIRRYPSETNQVAHRGSAVSQGAQLKRTYVQVATDLDGTGGSNMSADEQSSPRIGKPFSLWEKESVGFSDFIDIINPLHHIPVIATIYRNLSGDQIGAGPRVIGGALWGRLGGFVAGIVNAVVEWWSGKDIGDHIYAAIFGPAEGSSSKDTLVQNKESSPVTISSESSEQSLTASGSIASPPVATSVPSAITTPKDESNALPAKHTSLQRHFLRPVEFIAYEKNFNWEKLGEAAHFRFPA